MNEPDEIDKDKKEDAERLERLLDGFLDEPRGGAQKRDEIINTPDPAWGLSPEESVRFQRLLNAAFDEPDDFRHGPGGRKRTSPPKEEDKEGRRIAYEFAIWRSRSGRSRGPSR